MFLLLLIYIYLLQTDSVRVDHKIVYISFQLNAYNNIRSEIEFIWLLLECLLKYKYIVDRFAVSISFAFWKDHVPQRTSHNLFLRILLRIPFTHNRFSHVIKYLTADYRIFVIYIYTYTLACWRFTATAFLLNRTNIINLLVNVIKWSFQKFILLIFHGSAIANKFIVKHHIYHYQNLE